MRLSRYLQKDHGNLEVLAWLIREEQQFSEPGGFHLHREGRRVPSWHEDLWSHYCSAISASNSLPHRERHCSTQPLKDDYLGRCLKRSWL